MSFAEEFRNLRPENLMSQEAITHKPGISYDAV